MSQNPREEADVHAQPERKDASSESSNSIKSWVTGALNSVGIWPGGKPLEKMSQDQLVKELARLVREIKHINIVLANSHDGISEKPLSMEEEERLVKQLESLYARKERATRIMGANSSEYSRADAEADALWDRTQRDADEAGIPSAEEMTDQLEAEIRRDQDRRAA